MAVKSLSVFFPAYNEEGNIQSTVEKAITEIKKLKVSKWEILIINDGSKDKTPQIADNLAKKFPQVRVIHQENGGYGKAVKSGFYNSSLEWIVYTDSDGQFNFAELSKFLDKAESADAIDRKSVV